MSFVWLEFSALLCLLCFTCTATARSDTLVYKEDTVSSNSRQLLSLGGLFPFHVKSDGQCGAIRRSSVERAEAMVFAIRAINANTSLLPHVNLTFDIRDTCSIPNIALERAIEYVQNNDLFCSSANETQVAVSGIVGAARSDVSTSVASLSRLFQMPQISYASTAALLSDTSTFNYFFRTVPSDVLQTRAMADLIMHFNWTYIFALYSDNTYGREGIQSLINELEMRNDTRKCVAVLAPLPLGLTDTKPFDSVAMKMDKDWVRNASVAVLFGHVEEAIGMMDAIKKLGSKSPLQNITWIASDSWSVNLPRKYHEQARGMLSVLPDFGKVLEFEEYFMSLSPDGSSTENPWFNEYWESVFNCSLDVSLTGNSTRLPCDTRSQNLSDVRPSEKVPYVIDAVYAFAHAVEEMIADHCPNATICDEIVNTRSIGEVVDGALLRDYLFNVSFPSTFSLDEKLFDANGDVQGTYLIKNLQFSSDNQTSFKVIGTWDHINLLELSRDGSIQWNGGNEEPPQSVCSLPCEVGHQPSLLRDCCWECVLCLGENTVSSGEESCYECPDMYMPSKDRSNCIEIPVTYFTWHTPWAIAILVLTCIGIIATVLVAALFVAFYKNKVIKASSRELSTILLGGILLCYVLPFLFIAMPSPVLCGFRRFMIGFCFAVSYSALLARSNRIHRIFNQSTDRASKPPRFISATSQVVFTGILISIQVLIAVVWLAVEHPSVTTVQVDSRTVELKCGESPYIGLPVSLGYNFLLLILSTYFAFLTRNVPDNFNEAKFINVTLYSLCIIWIAFIPTYFVSTRFGTDYENFFLLLAVLLSASTTLVCLLVPKIVIIFWKEKSTTFENATVTGMTNPDTLSSAYVISSTSQ